MPSSSYLPAQYFSFFEVHFGGCGGYGTAVTFSRISAAAVGLRYGNLSNISRTLKMIQTIFSVFINKWGWALTDLIEIFVLNIYNNIKLYIKSTKGYLKYELIKPGVSNSKPS